MSGSAEDEMTRGIGCIVMGAIVGVATVVGVAALLILWLIGKL